MGQDGPAVWLANDILAYTSFRSLPGPVTRFSTPSQWLFTYLTRLPTLESMPCRRSLILQQPSSVLFWSCLGLGNSSINSGFVKEDLSNRHSLYVAQDRTGQDKTIQLPVYAC